MKILVVGDWHSNIHEEACFKALETLGHETYRFSWFEYFNRCQHRNLSLLKRLSCKFQNKYLWGPVIEQINNDLLESVKSICPEVVFVYRGTHILKETLEQMKETNKNILLVSYNNDDPFSRRARAFLWRHFVKSIPYYDINFVYRHHNIQDYEAVGAKNIHLLRSYYIPERNHYVDLGPEDTKEYSCDVVFVGHYEPDGREKYLEEVAKNGIKLNLFGSEWDKVVRKSKYLRENYPVRLVWDDEYNKALCGAKIALSFLSKLNRDTYTRRCFEIPATKTFMLSECSNDLASMFKEGVEAEYFRDSDELMQKIRYYLNYPDKRKEIANNGYDRVTNSGHDVISRMRFAIDVIEGHRANGF